MLKHGSMGSIFSEWFGYAMMQVPSSGDLSGSFLVGGGSFPLQSPYLPSDLSSTTVSVSATFTTSGLDMGFAWCDR